MSTLAPTPEVRWIVWAHSRLVGGHALWEAHPCASWAEVLQWAMLARDAPTQYRLTEVVRLEMHWTRVPWPEE